MKARLSARIKRLLEAVEDFLPEHQNARLVITRDGDQLQAQIQAGDGACGSAPFDLVDGEDSHPTLGPILSDLEEEVFHRAKKAKHTIDPAMIELAKEEGETH